MNRRDAMAFTSGSRCPDCGTKLSTKHYDAAYEWFECPKCEGCFTYDEILEAFMSRRKDESGKSQKAKGKGDRKGQQGKKAQGGRGKKRSHAEGENGRVQAGDAEIRAGLSKPVAKGKKRRTEIEEDEQAVEDFTKSILQNTIKVPQHKHHRDEVDSIMVVNAWADEIADVYHELGAHIDDVNAQDKALIIWREIHHLQGVSAREQEVPHALCGEHQ